MLAIVALCLLSSSLQRAEGAQNIALPSPVGQGRGVEHLRIRTYAHTGWNDGRVGSKRTFRSFSDIHVWAWHGIYHQALEIARVLRPYFNVTVRFQGNQWQGPDPALHSALFVLLAAHLMPSFPPHYVVFQTEQWGHPLLAEGSAAWGPAHGGAARRDCGDVFRGAVEVWDYSEQHVMQWRKRFAGAGVTFRYVPFAWFPAPQVNHSRKDIDVLFYGWLLPDSHRDATLKALQARGLPVKVANVDTFEGNLTALLLRTRVVLNIHFYEARDLEMCRILEAVSLGALVVSEPSADPALDALWADKVAFAEGVDELAGRLRFFLADERQRRARVERATAHARATHDLAQILKPLWVGRAIRPPLARRPS